MVTLCLQYYNNKNNNNNNIIFSSNSTIRLKRRTSIGLYQYKILLNSFGLNKKLHIIA